MLTATGLMMDLVGATMLALGLFRPAKALYPAWGRWPGDAAADQAYGLCGLLLLGGGFLVQGLPAFGVRASTDPTCALLAAGVALGGALAFAYLAYGFTYIWRFPREAKRHPDIDQVYSWSPGFPSFWSYEPDD